MEKWKKWISLSIWVSATIRLYRYCLSPLLGNACRFYPSCSEYTELAIKRFGFGRGAWLALQRICKCHPWHLGGIDEVPSKHKASL